MSVFKISFDKRVRYLDSKTEELKAIVENEASLETKYQEILAYLHKTKGGALTFGFAELGECAVTLEKKLISEEGAPTERSIHTIIDSIWDCLDASRTHLSSEVTH